MRINSTTLDREAEDTHLRFLKVFVCTLIQRLDDTFAAFTQLSPV
jgi:hypothetical protein